MQYKLIKLQREIRALVKKHYDAGTPELIAADIKKLMRRYKGLTAKQVELYRKSVEKKLLNEFVRAKTPNPAPIIDKMLSTDYAVVQGSVNNKITKAVERGIRSNMSIKEMTALIDRKVKSGKHQANTVARTARLAQNRALKLKKAIAAGCTKFKYTGPAPERDFCKLHYGKIYTIKEIIQLSNKQGLPVLVYMGGYNCKHYWQPVFD